MKWFKHISDSLDDPFIFELMEKHGATGYVVFFGILEIYAREFKVADGWKLITSVTYLKRKLGIYHKKTLLKCLATIGGFEEINQRLTKDQTEINQRLTKDQTKINQRSGKIDKRSTQNSAKWIIRIIGNEITIFIPKFKELMSEGTVKRIREHHKRTQALSGQAPTDDRIKEEEEEEEEDKESTYCAKTDFSFFLFESFWDAFDDKRGKESAIKSWQKIPNLTDDLGHKIIEGAKQYATERKTILAKGGTPKMAEGWLADKRWKDEFLAEKDWKEDARANLRRKEKELNDET